jgi:hypothetical protein
MGQVAEVSMFQGDCPWPTVKAGGREDAIGEVMCEVGIFFEEYFKSLGKVPVELRSKRC